MIHFPVFLQHDDGGTREREFLSNSPTPPRVGCFVQKNLLAALSLSDSILSFRSAVGWCALVNTVQVGFALYLL